MSLELVKQIACEGDFLNEQALKIIEIIQKISDIKAVWNVKHFDGRVFRFDDLDEEGRMGNLDGIEVERTLEAVDLSWGLVNNLLASTRIDIKAFELLKSLVSSFVQISEQNWGDFYDFYEKSSIQRNLWVSEKWHTSFKRVLKNENLKDLCDAANKLYEMIPVNSTAVFVGNTPQLLRYALEKIHPESKSHNISLALSGHPGQANEGGARLLEAMLTEDGLKNYDEYLKKVGVVDAFSSGKGVYFIDFIAAGWGIKFLQDSLNRMVGHGSNSVIAMNTEEKISKVSIYQSLAKNVLSRLLDIADGDARVMPCAPAYKFSDAEFMDSLVSRASNPFEEVSAFLSAEILPKVDEYILGVHSLVGCSSSES